MVAELTAPVLAFGLPGDTTTATGRALAVWADAGQPVHLSLRQLLRDPPRLPLGGRAVFVCENPSVVAEAAARVGTDCAPLVCTSGHPAAAATTLLQQLSAAGAQLRYHGDFDWPGLTIANNVLRRHSATAWHMTAADYTGALGAAGRPLRGAPTSAGWDPALTAAMRRHGLRIEEELVIDDLLADLAG